MKIKRSVDSRSREITKGDISLSTSYIPEIGEPHGRPVAIIEVGSHVLTFSKEEMRAIVTYFTDWAKL